jgi:hypothetical protein
LLRAGRAHSGSVHHCGGIKRHPIANQRQPKVVAARVKRITYRERGWALIDRQTGGPRFSYMNTGERFSWQRMVPQVKDEPKLKVVLLYENASIAERALGMLQLTAAEFDGRLDFHSSLWRFDLLEDAALRARATVQIIEADVLIVAVQDCAVPEAIRIWLRACLPQKRDAGGAVVLLLGAAAQGTPAEVDWLANTAAGAALDFLGPFRIGGVAADHEAERRDASDFGDTVRANREVTRGLRIVPPPIAAGPYARVMPSDHWGINE